MAVFEVSTLADSGAGSLRQAIADANALAGADTITFQASVTGNITLTTGDIDITDSVTIDGPGAAALSVSGNDASRIFYIYSPNPAPIDVTISGLTLTDGRSFVDSDVIASRGGAINTVGENLTVEESVVKDSEAGGDGGGIASTGAALTLRDSTIRNNHTYVASSNQGGDGGGVFANDSTHVLLDTVTLHLNAAAFDGGGIEVRAPQSGAEVTIVESTLHQNSSGARGHLTAPFPNHNGGGFSFESVPDFTILRTTMSGNTANYSGGAGGRLLDSQGHIENSTFTTGYNSGARPGAGLGMESSDVTITHTTFADNFALTAYNQQGNGVHAAAGSTVDVSNSIFHNQGGDDLYIENGSTIALRYTYVRDAGNAVIQDNGGNIIDPPSSTVFGPLQNNGGPTQTRLPQGVVVNAGDPAFTAPPATDQRGLARVNGGRIDMGAVELHPGTIQFDTGSSNVNENGGSIAVTVTRIGGSDGDLGGTLSIAGGGTATQGSDFASPSPNSFFWPSGNAVAQSTTILINDDATYEGDEMFTLQLAGAAIGTPSAHTVTIIENDPIPADLSISKSIAEPAPYAAGHVITFNIVVTNAGPADATNVVVTDVLPDGVTFLSATPPDACSGAPTVVCSLGTLGDGASATITIRARLDAGGDFTNSASVSSPTADEDANDNSDGVAFAVSGPAATADVPTLGTAMQIALAALIAALGLGFLKRS